MRCLPPGVRLTLCLVFTLTSGCSVPPITPTPAPASQAAAPTRTPDEAPTLAATTPSQAEACTTAGRVETGTYPGVVIHEELRFRIYLPPCYDPASGPYPTLYALHGKPFDDSHWDDLGLDEAAEAGIANGDWPDFLIVMPLVPEPLFSSTDGGPGSYEQEFLEGLLPHVEATYGADPRGSSRALAGISRGGVWALEIGLLHPDEFDGLAALSPALAVNRPRPQYDPLVIASSAGSLPAHIFLAAGDADWARERTEALAHALEQAGAQPELLTVAGSHEAATWRAVITPMLNALTSPWREAG